MTALFAKLLGLILNFIYGYYKKDKTRNKVTFISRQSEKPSFDFRYLINELEENYPQYEIEVLCKMIPKNIFGKLMYSFNMLRQMKAFATSKVVVLDGYCILASMLNHKDDLTIIQIWHALGSFKRFGRSILDMKGGKSSRFANAFKMHNNYDLIATSGDECVKFFSEAFGQPKEKFIPIGIPRMDYLTDEKMNERLRKRNFLIYPELDNGKQNILYVPTFRDNKSDTQALIQAKDELVEQVDYSKYNLIVKHHVIDANKEELYVNSSKCESDGEWFTGMDFMAIADYVISDYSSIIYEALLKNIPLYLYCFDSDKYIDDRGFYIDFKNDIPAVYSNDAKGIIDKIENNITAPFDKTEKFKFDYVNKKFPSITEVYGIIIDELIRGVYDNRFNYKAE